MIALVVSTYPVRLRLHTLLNDRRRGHEVSQKGAGSIPGDLGMDDAVGFVNGNVYIVLKLDEWGSGKEVDVWHVEARFMSE
eukprot:1353088-Amorphochlora_amoeboformis.AAC.1